MIKYAFGFDPGINHCAWAIVGTDGSVRTGFVKNKYKVPKGQKTDSWLKLQGMLEETEAEMRWIYSELKKRDCVAFVVEGQYAARGRGSPDHQIRNGWVAACCYTMIPGRKPNRIIAIPAEWTKNVPKEIRHPEMIQRVAPEEEWQWPNGDPPRGELYHNILDSVGLALWGLDKSVPSWDSLHEEIIK